MIIGTGTNHKTANITVYRTFQAPFKAEDGIAIFLNYIRYEKIPRFHGTTSILPITKQVLSSKRVECYKRPCDTYPGAHCVMCLSMDSSSTSSPANLFVKSHSCLMHTFKI